MKRGDAAAAAADEDKDDNNINNKRKKMSDNQEINNYKKLKINNFLKGRPTPNPLVLNPNTESFIFFSHEIDDETGFSPFEKRGRGRVPIIRMFGVTKEGNSVCCYVQEFFPYFYVDCPDWFIKSSDYYMKTFKKTLNEKISTALSFLKCKITEFVLSVEIVSKQDIYGYNYDKQQYFIKITIVLPKIIGVAKKILEEGKINISPHHHEENQKFKVYEANIDFILRFMVDTKVSGCSWIELPPKTWSIRRNEKEKETKCQIEIDVLWNNIVAHPPDDENWANIGPLSVLSFDIECAGRRGIFPSPEIDPVIQIGNVISKHGQAEEDYARVIFVLGGCLPIDDVKIFVFQSEKDMLMAWSRFIQRVDPDIITGYNINNFDLTYLIKRVEHLECDEQFYLSRIKNLKSTVTSKTFQNKQIGRITNNVINVEGRCILDVINIIKKEYKLRSYRLNAVSQHFLGQQKDDIHHTDISELYRKNDETRRKLANYCLKDAFLPLKLIDKLMLLFNYIEMARVTGVPLSFILMRGQQIKIISQLLRKCSERGFIIPSCEGKQKENEYQGATVIEPQKGFYNIPITTLDFCALYPTIMMAHNLCYSTLLKREDSLDTNNNNFYTKTPSGDYFVRPHIRKGLLPEILENLLVARKKAKADLKKETDPLKKKVLDGRQLALKISANSVYGFTGAQIGKLPCVEISQSVTAFGREMIMFTKDTVEKKYPKAKVIYGDTDSVMINFGVQSVQEAISLGQEAASHVTTFFINPIKLEFEKVYYPYLLINKKRYAGLYFTRPDTFDKIDCKGIETIRRDNCRLAADLIAAILKIILIERDIEKAINLVKEQISNLLNDKIEIAQLIITKELTKTQDEYKAKQAHVELANKMKNRDPGTAPKLGDRVPYVIIKNNNDASSRKNTPLYQKAENPDFVLKNNLQIDYEYYLLNQIKNPLLRIFDPILGKDAEGILLRGKHMMMTKTGTELNCVKVKLQCIHCNKFIQRNNKNLTCIQCRKLLKMGKKNISPLNGIEM